MTDVVTAFARHRGEVLLIRRSDAVGTYAGLWGGISGYVEPETDDPREDAERELREEAGYADPTFVRAGEPLHVVDGDREWTVHPFLYDVDSRAVDPNEELADFEWVAPTDIRERETVPGLWGAYRRVAPSVETVRGDDEHGSAYVSARALDVLRDAAAEAGDWNEAADVARELRRARPSMTAISTRIDRAVTRADGDAAALVESAHEELRSALDADDEAADQAAERLADDGAGTVLTLSRSGTVLATLERADVDVLVCESRPAREGVDVAEELAAGGADVTLFVDAAAGHVLDEADVDAVVVGADTVLADGSVVNKAGTRLLGFAADHGDVPLYVVAARDKVSPSTDFSNESGPAEAVYDGDVDLRVANPTFDRTPAEFVSAVLTEDGPLVGDDVREVAREHRELGAWADE